MRDDQHFRRRVLASPGHGKTPTFTFEGNLASFNPRAKKHVSLLFHTGAAIPGKHPLLQGGGDTARYLNLASLAEVAQARKGLEAIVRAWIKAKQEAPPPRAPAKKKRPAASR